MLKSTVAGDLSMNGADIAETGAGGGASSEGDEEMDQEAHDRKQANMQSQRKWKMWCFFVTFANLMVT